MPVRDLLSAASGASAPADPYFYDVSLLLNGDGTNGAQNNTFLDSSTNNFTITRNGNTTQGSFSPYGSLWGNYFDGSSYLASAATGVANFGTGNYTAEYFIYCTSFATGCVYDCRPNGNGAYLTLNYDSTGHPQVVSNGGTTYGSPTAMILNSWNHVVVVRGGTGSNQCAMFINGTRVGTFTDSTNYSDNRQIIGATAYFPYGSNPVLGYISNLRIVKGADVYGYSNSTITVPSAPLTAVSGTSLLTCQSNRFIDNSSNNFTLTPTGSPSVQRFSPFNPIASYSTSVIGGSGYFDGSTSYLNTASSSSFSFGTGNFTVEAWVYATAFTIGGGESVIDNWIISFATSSAANFWLRAGANAYLQYYNNAGSISIQSSSALPTNTWIHVAVVRNGSTVTLYQNGVSVASGTDSTNFTTVYPCNIGSQPGQSRYWNGYITDSRVTNTAVYTTTFTPPTAPLTAISGTQLLTNFTNAGIPDLAMQNDLQTVGDAQVSTSVKKYGTGSLYFNNGSGNYLYAPSTPSYGIGTGDFTIEFWMYKTASSTQASIVGFGYGGTTGSIGVSIGNNTDVWVATQGVALDFTFSAGLTLNTWYHIALTRAGTAFKCFVNGTQVGSTATNTKNYKTAFLNVGVDGDLSNQWFGGYIDDLRITNGLARYTANFTPPTSALPTY